MVCFAYASKTGVKNCLSDDYFNPIVTLTDENFESITGVALESLPLGSSTGGSSTSGGTSGTESPIGSYTSYSDKGWIVAVTKSTESCDACKATKTAMNEMAADIKDSTNGAIKLATVDADLNPALAAKLEGKIFSNIFSQKFLSKISLFRFLMILNFRTFESKYNQN